MLPVGDFVLLAIHSECLSYIVQEQPISVGSQSVDVHYQFPVQSCRSLLSQTPTSSLFDGNLKIIFKESIQN
jgi:hypothetical protein